MGDTVSPASANQLFDMSGRVALVTGGTGYLGRAMCRALAEAGARVVVTSRDLARASRAASELPSINGTEHIGVQLDQLNEESLKSGFDAAVRAAGQVDILINNGQQGHALDLTSVSGEAFSQDLQNVTGYFLLARHLRDHVVERGVPGTVVMIGSMYGVVGSYPDAYDGVCVASPVQYHALKGGIVHMTRHLAVYWAKDSVRVNCLSPGPFPNENAPQEMVNRLIKKSPMRRMGLPEELNGPLLLLATQTPS